jgi:hypothetical protein
MYYPQVYGDPKFMYKQNSRAEYKIYNRAVVIVNRGKNARNKKSYVESPVYYRSCTSEDDVDDVARR